MTYKEYAEARRIDNPKILAYLEKEIGKDQVELLLEHDPSTLIIIKGK